VARRFEVSVRTAYRDLDSLRDEWRVPLEFDRDRGTFRLTEPTALVTPVTLSRGEVVAVFFAERVLAQYRGTPFEVDLGSAFRKIQELLPEEVSVSPETLDAVLSLDLGPVHTPDASVFAEVLASLSRRRSDPSDGAAGNMKGFPPRISGPICSLRPTLSGGAIEAIIASSRPSARGTGRYNTRNPGADRRR